MKSTLRILFFVKGKCVKRNGKVPIQVRVTVDGDQVQFSVKQDVDPGIWDAKNGKAIGRSPEALRLNNFISTVHGNLTTRFNELTRYGEPTTAAILRDAFLGFDVKNDTLLKVFAAFNERHERLIGIEIAQSTFNKYDLTYRRLEEFLKVKKKANDIPLYKVNLDFVMDFENFLRVDYRLDTNSSEKLMRIFKRIMTIARKNGLIKIDPFGDYKLKKKKKDRGYLTHEELDSIINYKPTSERLEKVRDIFVFCCMTGLDYSGVATLTTDDMVTGFDDGTWILKDRAKTGVQAAIKLLSLPMQIISKYEPKRDGNRLLPVMSNAKYNQYLKELAGICGIGKRVTSHLARHTFATTVALANGVSIESLSKMLGHTKITTTQIYAKMLNSKVGADMDALAQRINYALPS